MTAESSDKKPRERQQYHYFYGSTDAAADSPASMAQQEQESLIGDAFINTDNEEETPNSSEHDLQHLVITNGHGLFSRQEVPGTRTRNEPSSSFKSWFSSCSRSRREEYPVGRVAHIALTVVIVLCMMTFAIILFPSISSSPSAQKTPGIVTYMPFSNVDRKLTNDPASNFLMKDLFHPQLRYNGSDHPREFTFPFPTGAFWTNLVLNPTADRGYSYPVMVYPYAYKWGDDALQVSYPALRPLVEPKHLLHSFAPDVSFTTSEAVTGRHVVAFDPLSVTIRFQAEEGGLWESYLVQGSPYVTIRYQKATPIIRAMSIYKSVLCPDADLDTFDESSNGRRLKYGVCTPLESDDDKDMLSIRGVQFLLQTQEGSSWIMFTSEPMTLNFDTIRKTTVMAGSKYTGVVRLALIPPSKESQSSSSNSITSSTGIRRLIYHAGIYPVGGDVDWEFRSAGTTASLSHMAKGAMTGMAETASSAQSKAGGRFGTVHFKYSARTFRDMSSIQGPSVSLLMLALPHHADLLSPGVMLDSETFDLKYRCIKGDMTPVLGSTWSYDEPIFSLGFDGFPRNQRQVDSVVSHKILDQVEKDLESNLPTLNENVYGFGKQVARLAQLAHIANKMLPRNETMRNSTYSGGTQAKSKASQLKAKAVELLTSFLHNFLTNDVSDALVYDASLGGLVTANGLRDPNADFGNGRYNDHHFHYGYILYACAVLGRFNSSFISEYGPSIDVIMYDIANQYNKDSSSTEKVFFPFARHKSWFDGHSFASGMFPFATGKSQESSSEAVNCYYGAYLWSLVRHRAANDAASDTSSSTDFMRLLLASEIRGAKKYWHIGRFNSTGNEPDLYSPIFLKNYMVGNLGMMDVDCSTWFGTSELYVHMINFMPVTGATELLFDRDYAGKEYENLVMASPNVEMAWRGYVVCDHAITNPEVAWKEAEELISYQLDSGLSKSQVLYWISTRTNFTPPDEENVEAPDTPEYSNKPESGGDTKSSECQFNQKCRELGLTGLCCPTASGVALSCCDQEL